MSRRREQSHTSQAGHYANSKTQSTVRSMELLLNGRDPRKETLAVYCPRHAMLNGSNVRVCGQNVESCHVPHIQCLKLSHKTPLNL